MKQAQSTNEKAAASRLHRRLDEMVDTVLDVPQEVKKTVIRDKAAVETWSIPLDEIYKNENLRLDATHYDRQTAAALEE